MFNSRKLVPMVSVATLAVLVSPQAIAHELQVVSTFSILSDFAKKVGGERIALTTLVGPNGDAHSYEPRPADAVAVGKAKVVLANGLHFEGFLERLIQATGGTASVIELTKGVKLLRNTEDGHGGHEGHDPVKGHAHDHAHDHDHAEARDHGHADERDHGHVQDHDQKHDHDYDHDHAHDHGKGHDHAHAGAHGHHHHHGEYDPHAWQSVSNAQIYVSNIAEAFCAVDEAGCQSYRANAESYGEKLQALEGEIRATMAQIPSAQRTVITSHDAFAYLGQEYGLRFLAPQGVSTEAEASAASVASLIRQVKSQKVSAIFLENISNPRLVQQIASETGLTIGGKLYSDALSTEDGPASTYIDMMRHNVNTIRDAALGR